MASQLLLAFVVLTVCVGNAVSTTQVTTPDQGAPAGPAPSKDDAILALLLPPGCDPYMLKLRRPEGMGEFGIGLEGKKACDPCSSAEEQLNFDIDDLVETIKELHEKKHLLRLIRSWKGEGARVCVAFVVYCCVLNRGTAQQALEKLERHIKTTVERTVSTLCS